ncbi:FAD-binding domain-containing protein [Synechococcus sp. PCC 6312]|uniref:FAD-binding domain-containing protein n=1 Tax=Synechococcus sp. (strain ATCC 27167 / PCC 6312) TaxID=195253 RepID=UPI00029ECC25|nr:FAD-binding domain-containing protein [Synechococcus sp. PCC 6312]AFY62664.1 deoxyribodipyrimidine photolyase [Synechococcus sp. PCC 6312]
MSSALRRTFTDRADLIHYLKQEFPEIAAEGDQVSAVVGGRTAAELALARIQPGPYGQTRNYLAGAVTRLSPYLRHGVLSLAEVKTAVLAQIQTWTEGEKLITELAWRDYWQRLYERLGDHIWQDLEPYKTGWQPRDYQPELPPDIDAGRTGLACMDGFSQELKNSGYLHNHARMWLAAYVVHWRKVRWQAGAAWFLHHLLDGDPASNNLSWQWVASTFSHKPYFFNRDNLERYSQGQYCPTCSLQYRCPLQGSYSTLAAKLFPNAPELQNPQTNSGQFHRSKPQKNNR